MQYTHEHTVTGNSVRFFLQSYGPQITVTRLHQNAPNRIWNSSHAATNKTNKCCQLSGTHIFTPVVIETAGTWHHQAVGPGTWKASDYHYRRLQGDHLYVFQQFGLSVVLQKETNAVSFQNTFTATSHTNQLFTLFISIFSAYCSAHGFVLANHNNNNNNNNN